MFCHLCISWWSYFFYGMLSTPYSVESWYGVSFFPSIYFSPCLWPPKDELLLNALSSVSLSICVCFFFFRRHSLLFSKIDNCFKLFSWSRGFHLFDTKRKFSGLCSIRLVFSCMVGHDPRFYQGTPKWTLSNLLLWTSFIPPLFRCYLHKSYSSYTGKHCTILSTYWNAFNKPRRLRLFNSAGVH